MRSDHEETHGRETSFGFFPHMTLLLREKLPSGGPELFSIPSGFVCSSLLEPQRLLWHSARASQLKP